MKKIYIALIVFAAFANSVCSQITIINNDTTICSGSVNLSATVLNASNPISLNLSDDQFSGVINIGFTFQYYGTNHTQCLISSNNYIRFNLTGAGGFSPWTITNPVPDAATTAIHNAILGPWQDIDPSAGGTVRYATLGTAPNRIFVVEYCNVPMYSCTSLQFSSQIQLHENGNRIQTHIINKPLCTTWNNGRAIHATHNANGTQATVVPGRNSPSQWTVTNEGREFVWNGTTYVQSIIPFSPIILGNPSNIQWTIAGNPTVIGTGPNITVSPTVTTAYVASVTGGCAGIPFTDTVLITVGGNLDLSNAVVTNSSCSVNNGSITVNPQGGSGNYTYLWSPGGQTTQTINNLAPGNYSVTVTDLNNGCVGNASFTITNGSNLTVNISNVQNVTCNGGNDGQATANAVGAMGTVSFSWDSNPIQTNATATNLPAGTYTVTATDAANGCTATATVTITEPTAVTGTITVNNNVSCNGGSNGSATVNASGGNGTYTYSWAPSGGSAATSTTLSAGNYTVTITDGNGCQGTASTTITEPTALTSTMQSTNVTCNGASNGTATVTPSGGTGPYTYFWPLSGNTTNTQTNMFAGTFTVTITDANGCQITDTVVITQPAPIQVNSTSTPASCGMSNGTATANVVSGGTGPYTFSWPQSGQNSQTATGLPAGNANFTVTDANGCTANGVANVATINDHVASASANPTTGVVPLTVNFTNNSQNTTTYFWDFGNNTTSTATNPSTTYNNEGTYTVMLIATNAGGCSDTTYLTIVVLNESFLLVPNVFSPNGDGLNDEFKVQYQYITEFKMTIANRWGTILYETSNIDQGWDGKHNGNLCADGTYYYIIKAIGIEGKEYNLNGHLTMFTKK